MTTEQAEAFAQLRTLAGPGRLRVRPDTEGWPVIPGRLGQIEYHDGRDLAVFTDRPRLHAKLSAIPGVRRHQTGDQEMRALFPPEALELVAGGHSGPAATGQGDDPCPARQLGNGPGEGAGCLYQSDFPAPGPRRSPGPGPGDLRGARGDRMTEIRFSSSAPGEGPRRR